MCAERTLSVAGAPSAHVAVRTDNQVDIIIQNSSNKPIYEQIGAQIKDAILSGELTEGQPLPSIRALANDLRVSVITTKRAYTDLEAAGFLETVQGKGTFVAGGNKDLIREDRLRTIEEHLQVAIEQGQALGLDGEELVAMLRVLLESE